MESTLAPILSVTQSIYERECIFFFLRRCVCKRRVPRRHVTRTALLPEIAAADAFSADRQIYQRRRYIAGRQRGALGPRLAGWMVVVADDARARITQRGSVW